jgi:hypothetical protein
MQSLAISARIATTKKSRRAQRSTAFDWNIFVADLQELK